MNATSRPVPTSRAPVTPLTIVIPGGSGHVGTLLATALHEDGHDVVVLSRRPAARPWRVVPWDAATLGPWTAELERSDVVINLTGRSVNCRYTPAHRREILESRIGPTRVLGEAIAHAARPPHVWLQASTATIYAHRFDAPNDEATGLTGGAERDAPPAWRFSIDVARAWERAFQEAAVPATRKIALRSAMIMSPEAGGIFDTLIGLVRHGLGGRAGDGRQFVSWIHGEDFVRAIRRLIDHDDFTGVVNVAAPHPLPNREFMRILRHAAGMPLGLPAAGWMLAIGSVLLRTETELILKSRRVVPQRLLEDGFTFTYPRWSDAAPDLCRRWRQARRSLPIPQHGFEAVSQ
jgi:uncharacterized protein (TIGR01777 family)